MNDNTLTLSIVIPVYNEEDYIQACLTAIANQTVMPEEVIVVDNNSTDNSAQLARSYPFVKILHETLQGVPYARDTGFNAVKSELIGRIDGDTLLPHDWVENMITMFREEPKLDATSGPTGFHDLPCPGLTLFFTKVIRSGLFYIGRKKNKYLFGSNMALRATAWQAVSKDMCHVPGNHEDNDLAVHLERAGYNVHYSNRVIAMISARRADASPRQAWWYAFSEYRTYRSHHVTSIHGLLAGIILLAVYIPIKLWRRAYDDRKKKYSLTRLLHYRPMPRSHPME